MKFNLNRELVLEDPVRQPDGAGGYDLSWVALGTLWADLRPGSGREREVHALTRSQVPFVAVVRAAAVGAPSRPKAGQRFRDGTRIFHIHAVSETAASRQFLSCRVLEEVAT